MHAKEATTLSKAERKKTKKTGLCCCNRKKKSKLKMEGHVIATKVCK
jgi:hypothetical protein